MQIQKNHALQAWERPRGSKRHCGLASFLSGAVGDRSSSCGGVRRHISPGNRPRRRPPTRKPCTERLCWEPCTLFEVERPGTGEPLRDAREAQCHVCREWLQQKPLFGRPLERFVRRDPLFLQYWVCTSCVSERDWSAQPTTPTGGREPSCSNSRPHTPTEESRVPRRSLSLPGLKVRFASDAAATEGRRPKPRPPQLLNDDTPVPSPMASPAGSLAQAGAAVLNDLSSQGRRSNGGSPIGKSWEHASCQVCFKAMSSLETAESRVCNACEAKFELNAVSLRGLPLKSGRPAQGVGHLSVSWDLIDFSASK